MNPTDTPLVTRAHALAAALMANGPEQVVESYRHGQAVAKILAAWQAGPNLQAAGLLHSLVWQGLLSRDSVAESCDEQTAFLTEAYRQTLQQVPGSHWRGKAGVLSRVRFFLAAYQDPALALLGVANLWDHFDQARLGSLSRQRLFADEAEEVLIPLLQMLGMWELKETVEEWAMQHGSCREDYDYLRWRLAQSEETRRRVFDMIRDQLQPVLVSARLARRKRTPVHIYQPQLPEKAHPDALQKLTVDVLVDTEAECYAALHRIHHFWQPVEQSLVDTIGASKLNGYRCLQTAVIVPLGPGHIRADFHIRTWEMDEINRWGLAALEMGERRQVSLPRAWWYQRAEHYARISAHPVGSFPRMLYVFSPLGQIFGFHRGCTVVDYAYQVHSELAHQCKRFKVNGEIVSPITPLHHLDLVELERDPQFAGPDEVWLNAAHTDRARSHIQRYLKRRSQGWLTGQTVLERRLRALEEYYRIDVPEQRVRQALSQAVRQLNFARMEDLLAEIAVGRVTADRILHPLFDEEITRQVQLPAGLRLFPHQLSLAQCCKPRPGNDIVGRSRRRAGETTGLKVHRTNCPHITSSEGIVPLTWRLQPQLRAAARLEMTGLDEDRLLTEALETIYAQLPHVTLHQVEAVARNGIARLCFTLEATDYTLINLIAADLKQLPGHTINEVRQMQLLFSEREDLISPMAQTTFNPYRRLPVKEREMFFGRAEELARVSDWLRAGVEIIFIRGQKRVGKTSLLLHLKEYYLDRGAAVPVFVDFQALSQLASPDLFYELASAIYNDLLADGRIGDINPPLRELFEEATPPARFAAYLRSIQSHFGLRRLVLLVDEFSRTMDAYQQQRLDESFFHQWRAILQNTTPEISYILVVQQQTYDSLLEQMQQRPTDPSWHLFEMGETLVVNPLSEKDARQLIERPTFNHLEYPPDLLHQVWRLTGGSPFLIQAFCFNLVRHMARSNRRRVEWDDVNTIQAEFMHPQNHLFAHLMDLIRGLALPVCLQLARLTKAVDRAVSLAELQAALPHLPEERLLGSLHELVHQHILVQPAAGQWQFASLLFGRWLALNSAPLSTNRTA